MFRNLFKRDEHGVEAYGWIHVCAVAYMVLVGVFAVQAWVIDEQPFKAAMCAGAQGLAVVTAILARRAFNDGMWLAGILGVAAAFGCAVWAAKGIGHAWAVNSEPVEDWQVWFLAGLEPGLFLLAEHVQSKRIEKAKARAQDARDDAERLQAIRDASERREAREHELRLAQARADAVAADAPPKAQENGTRPANVTRLSDRPRRSGAVEKGVVAVGAGSAAVQGAAAAEIAQPTDPVGIGHVIEAPAHAGENARVARAMALKGQGLERRQVAKKMNCSVRTVTRLWAAGDKANAAALALAS